ncbi:MAG TPA: hypothetical protein VFJ98_00565 [Mycobacteriales bacterium]|nr:hypothetical protein [Mycobacteriales bacterium]
MTGIGEPTAPAGAARRVRALVAVTALAALAAIGLGHSSAAAAGEPAPAAGSTHLAGSHLTDSVVPPTAAQATPTPAGHRWLPQAATATLLLTFVLTVSLLAARRLLPSPRRAPVTLPPGRAPPRDAFPR